MTREMKNNASPSVKVELNCLFSTQVAKGHPLCLPPPLCTRQGKVEDSILLKQSSQQLSCTFTQMPVLGGTQHMVEFILLFHG